MYLYAAIAALPILFTIIFMAVFNWPAKRALPFSWLIACLVTGFVWKMDFLEISARTISGFLSALETLFIIFGALLLMNVLSSSLVPWQQSINSSPELRVMRESRQSWSDMFLLDSSKALLVLVLLLLWLHQF